MGSDARALTEFYQTPMGQMARRVIQARLQDFWPDLRGRRLLGYGFAIPYLPLFAGQAERAIAASVWPARSAAASAVPEPAAACRIRNSRTADGGNLGAAPKPPA